MKSLGRFVVWFAIVFGLLAWPWTGMREAWRVIYRAQVGWVIESVFTGKELRVESLSDARHPRLDTAVGARGLRDGDGAWEIPFDSVAQGLLPLAMLTALYAATPVAWSRRWRPYLAGLAALELMGLLTIWVQVSGGLAEAGPDAGPGMLLMTAHRLLAENIWISFVAPLLWWIVWLARGGHWLFGAEWLNDRAGCAPIAPRRHGCG